MKLGLVAKLDKRNKITSKKIGEFCFRFMDNLRESGRRIPVVWSVKLTFSFTVSFYLTRTENRNKIKKLRKPKGYIF